MKKKISVLVLATLVWLPVSGSAGEPQKSSPSPMLPHAMETSLDETAIDEMPTAGIDLNRVGYAMPEVTTMVEMSNRDLNRIHCPAGPVADLLYSKEKGVTGHFTGNNAFVKFMIDKMGDKVSYAKAPVEMFVICDGSVYPLIVMPKNIPAATVRLSPDKKATIKKNTDAFAGMAFEKKCLKLIKEGYTGEYPEGYSVQRAKTRISLSADLDVNLVLIAQAEGTGMIVKELQVIAKKDVELAEKDFLSRNVGERIAAVAIDKRRLVQGEKTRVLVVEHKEAL